MAESLFLRGSCFRLDSVDKDLYLFGRKVFFLKGDVRVSELSDSPEGVIIKCRHSGIHIISTRCKLLLDVGMEGV